MGGEGAYDEDGMPRAGYAGPDGAEAQYMPDASPNDYGAEH